jgi:hypothetical protein
MVDLGVPRHRVDADNIDTLDMMLTAVACLLTNVIECQTCAVPTEDVPSLVGLG